MSVMERRRVSARRESLLGDEPGAFASARFVRVSPMKARRVVDLVRGLNVDEALSLLEFAPQAASESVPARAVTSTGVYFHWIMLRVPPGVAARNAVNGIRPGQADLVPGW